MRADTQLDYAIFQLTPTRTRCELLIAAKGATYKLASGLLKPFVSHLRAAEEQLAKGGYSLRLEPPDPSRASWFTKGTMERFVRFVSTPEVLERVSSVEEELLELEETARQQIAETNDANGLGQVDISLKTATSQEFTGGKLAGTSSLDKATKVLSDGVENGTEENSKQRLLRALDARRMMLQKEQGMAFARALAAGFNPENMDDLVLFAECFGADRLREACAKFQALCKKREEAGMGLEDVELMAADTSQADMLYMGAVGGNTMGLVWPHLQGNGLEAHHLAGAPLECNQVGGENFAEKPCEEATQTGLSSMSAGRDGDSLPTVVKGHPMLAAWQGQPHNQFMPGVAPYATMHPGMANHFDPSFGFTGPARPGQMGLAYPHYLGGSYMPVSYPDGNGWQPHSPVPPQYWAVNQPNDPADGSHHRSSHQQSVSTPSSRELDKRESNSFDGDDTEDHEEDYAHEILNDLSGRPGRRSTSPRRRPARHSTSPRRRSASPKRKVQTGRSGGSKRSGMVVIRNINYIAPNAKNRNDDNSEDSDSWSDDNEEEVALGNGAETLRTSIENAVEAVEGRHRPGRSKHPKKNKKEAASKDSGHQIDTDGDDAFLDDEETKKQTNEGNEYVWVIDRRNSGVQENSNVFSEEVMCSGNGVQNQGAFVPAAESVSPEKRDPAVAEFRSSPEDATLQCRIVGNGSTESKMVDMFEQERHVETKKLPIMDDSYMVLGGENPTVEKHHEILEPDYDLNIRGVVDPEASKAVPDDSFILLDRSVGRGTLNEEWSVPLNLEAEMPSDQSHEPAIEANNFEPDDLFMVPDRDQNAQWNSPLHFDMQVLAADFLVSGRQGEDDAEDAEAVGNTDVQEQEVEENFAKSIPRKLSEKDAKAKSMKEMLERRKSSGGGRSGRSTPLAEAQLRADKLRLYKAGLQKSKQEREEEDRKRIEDLRMQRQQRIAARSNPGGTSQFAPSSIKGARTPPPIANKSSTKVPSKVSPLSSSVSRERLTNGSRVARSTSDGTKPTGNSVTRSISSLTELQRESKMSTSAVRASTGCQVLSPNMKIERHTVVNTRGKSDDQAEDKAVGAKVGRADHKVGRTSSLDAEERVGRSESGRIDEKIIQAESGHIDESGAILKKALPIATKAAKRVVAQDGPVLHVKSPRSPAFDRIGGKRTLTVQSEKVDGLVSQVKSPKSPAIESKGLKKTSTVPMKPAAQRKLSSAPTGDTADKLKTESALLPPSLKVKSQAGKAESPVGLFDVKDSSPIVAEIGLSNGNGNKHVPDLSMAAPTDGLSVVKASHGNGLFLSSPAVTPVEESKPEASKTISSLEADLIMMPDERQASVETSCPLEESDACGEDVSSSDDNNCAFVETNVLTSEEPLAGDYSPPFAPPSEDTRLPVNCSLITQTTQQASTMELSPSEEASLRSRKKWGDSKAKGLKKFLLLGRKSSRSSAQNGADVPSEGEEEESHSRNGKNISIKLYDDLDTLNNQAAASVLTQGDFGSNSSGKGSRSIFSLSTFRGNKSSVKA